jgi:hypothetical protein
MAHRVGEPEWLLGRIPAWEVEIKYLLVCKKALGLLPTAQPVCAGTGTRTLLRAYPVEGQEDRSSPLVKHR